jgi:hypothetical protein
MTNKPYVIQITWTNSATGQVAEKGACALPEDLQRLYQPVEGSYPERFEFEYYDQAYLFFERITSASLKCPLMRDGRQAIKDGHLLWWIPTVDSAGASLDILDEI